MFSKLFQVQNYLTTIKLFLLPPQRDHNPRTQMTVRPILFIHAMLHVGLPPMSAEYKIKHCSSLRDLLLWLVEQLENYQNNYGAPMLKYS